MNVAARRKIALLPALIFCLPACFQAGQDRRRKIYRSIEELQADLDAWISEYNEERPHQGRWCFGKTPMQTFLDAKPLAKEKMIAA